MKATTAELWEKQDQHTGDRLRLFTAIGAALDAADGVDAATALYPGSYVDIAPSFVFGSVTYVEVDKRAPKFFADVDGVAEIIAENGGPTDAHVEFIHADYTTELGPPTDHFDLLISLYAGFVSEHCTQHLRVGGTLLVNPSHGDAAMASIDPRYELAGVVTSRNGEYSVTTSDLDQYLVPKRPEPVTVDLLHQSGRGVAYTRSPFAYLFTRIA